MEFDYLIHSKNKLLDIKLKEILSKKDLLFLLVKRDFISQFKQTILGPIWFVIQPIMLTLVFVLVFGNIAQISTNGQPKFLFYLSGIILWNFFSDSVFKISNVFFENQAILNKVYFPRLILPISVLITNFLKFIVQFLLFVVVYFYFKLYVGLEFEINFYLIFIPLIFLITAVFGLSIGLTLASLTVKYRDLKFLIQFGLQLAMYATPVVYPLSLTGKFKSLFLLNPMTNFIEVFRFSFFGKADFDLLFLSYSICLVLVLLIFGLITFNRVQKTFVDSI